MRKGFSLLELLIAICIFSIGVLGIASLEIISLNHLQDAYWQSLAATQVSSMLERQKRGDNDCATKWKKEIANLLPHAQGKCTKSKISLCWRGKLAKQNCIAIVR